MSYEPYPDDDGTMLRECKGCAGEYAIRTDDALESAGLVGEGCPWATVQQMADDLGKAQFSYSASITDLAMDRDPPGRADCQARTDRVAAAAALLSSGSNP